MDTTETSIVQEQIFERTVRRLVDLPGRVEIGRTSDMGDRYAAWYPYNDRALYVQFILHGEQILMTSNVIFAEYWQDPLHGREQSS
jgi:hypothetical protein